MLGSLQHSLDSLAGFKGTILLTGGEGRKVGEGKGKCRGEKGREEEGHEHPPVRTKFTRAYGGAEVRERRGQGREQWRI